MIHSGRLFSCLLIAFSLPVSLAVSASTNLEIENALDEMLLHHPAEIIGFDWHDIPAEKADLHIAKIYHDAGLRPVWVTEEGPGKRAIAIYEAIRNAADDGLEPGDYGLAEIENAWASRKPEDLARLDILITVGLVEYISDVRHGRVQPVKENEAVYYHGSDKKIDSLAIVKEVLAAEDTTKYLAAQLPTHRFYRQTREGLKRYRELAKTAKPSRIPEGVTIHPGEVDSRLPAIREHLVLTGDLEAGSDSTAYDDTTVDAIKHYQSRHGLTEDGVIGKDTITELNVPFAYRVRQVEMNLERLRWTAHDLGSKYILVDIPAFTAVTVDNDQVAYEMPVIVGKHYHETPVFSETIKYVVINPYWTLTPSIARNETLPKLRKDPGYLEKKHISLFKGWSDNKEIDPRTIDWNNVTRKEMNQYRLRQNPGPWNALGVLKIVFPNEHSVYMHDTPNHNLFDRSVKAFSHGCIRMDEPVKQAELVLSETDSSWTEERINEVVKSGVRTVVRLKEPMPVHIMYQTAWGDKDGVIHFVRDIYGRDKKLEQVLY